MDMVNIAPPSLNMHFMASVSGELLSYSMVSTFLTSCSSTGPSPEFLFSRFRGAMYCSMFLNISSKHFWFSNVLSSVFKNSAFSWTVAQNSLLAKSERTSHSQDLGLVWRLMVSGSGASFSKA